MVVHEVRVHKATERLPREAQLAWKFAEYGAALRAVDPDVAEMVACRVIDNAAVALAAVNRQPVVTARAMALAHPRPGGATLFGLPAATEVHAEWAAWANATAVRELDFHDAVTPGGHPGDNIPTLLAVAQQTGRSGAELVRGLAVAYEVQVALCRYIPLVPHEVDQFAHLAPATAAGLCALLGLPAPVAFQAINLAVHLAISTTQNRKGKITSWKAFAPGYYGKMAIEAVDRAMRGEAAPSPIYEGEVSVIATILGGPETRYAVAFPAVGEPPRAILETYTKAYSAVIYAQAFIDLAFELRRGLNLAEVAEIVVHTSRTVHRGVGSGADDPEKYDPRASRESLDHSLPYILAVALEDGRWHHEESYAPERVQRPETVALWQKIRTAEDPAWSERFRHPDPSRREFGGRIEIRLADGRVVAGELGVAHAQPRGKHPWGFEQYAGKFRTLTEGLLPPAAGEAFLALAHGLSGLGAADLRRLNPELPPGRVAPPPEGVRGIFDHPSGAR